MAKKKVKKERKLGPVTTIIVLIFVIMIMSAIFSIFKINGQITAINNGTLETSLVTAQNAFTKEGITYIFDNVITNFRMFEPLVLLIMSLIATSIAEASGLLKATFQPLKKLRPNIITFLVLLTGILSSFIGEYNYIILLPLVLVLYKYLGRNQMLGVLTIFIGIVLGSGTGIISGYNDYLLGNLTQASATLEVDKTYQFNLNSNLYIMLISTILMCIIGTNVINKFLLPKLPKNIKEEDELIVSKKAFVGSTIIFVIFIILLTYMITPGLPGSGLLLASENDHFIVKLLGDNAPFKEGFMLLFILMMMACSFVYGKISGNIKSTNEYSVGLSKSFEKIGYVFVLMFFMSILVNLIEWTNVGQIIATSLIDFMSKLQFSGIALIVVMFIVIILISIVVPSTLTKWEIASPLLVPLFMRSNITPDFTLFIFKVADGIGKCITPLFIYFIIMLAFLQKANNAKTDSVTVFGTLKIMAPTVGLLTALWLLIIITWYIVGLPLGPGMYPTL